ncbi:MAG: SDR family NAD(P)-dependent oxidoreductase [Allorhizobium sp.]
MKNKTALVLGASRGLGAAIARGLAEEGVAVHAAARNTSAISAWASELAPTAGPVIPLQLDLADIDSVNGAIASLIAAGGIDILVNNSGGPPPAAAIDAKRTDWLTHFETMAANVFHITTSLLPGMREKRWGRIISIAGLPPWGDPVGMLVHAWPAGHRWR